MVHEGYRDCRVDRVWGLVLRAAGTSRAGNDDRGSPNLKTKSPRRLRHEQHSLNSEYPLKIPIEKSPI